MRRRHAEVSSAGPVASTLEAMDAAIESLSGLRENLADARRALAAYERELRALRKARRDLREVLQPGRAFGQVTLEFAEPRSDARRAENVGMLKRLIRDLWGKRTEKKALNPEMRNMLVSLNGVYEQESSSDSPQSTAEQHVGETHRR